MWLPGCLIGLLAQICILYKGCLDTSKSLLSNELNNTFILKSYAIVELTTIGATPTLFFFSSLSRANLEVIPVGQIILLYHFH